MRALRFASLGLCGMLSFGCASNQSGAAEGFRVRGAEFIEGPLPGEPTTDMPSAEPGDAEPFLRVTSFETASLDVMQGQGGKGFRGRVSQDAAAVGVALAGVGSGYWVLPVGVADFSTDPPELTWNVSVDFDRTIKVGKHKLLVVAIDEQGNAGQQFGLDVCVAGLVPDNRSACYPDKAPPRAVIALTWDVNADLDLQVVDPDGRVIDAKHPNTLDLNEMGKLPPESGSIDRDSVAACVGDGLRSENLIWNTDAPQGAYQIYVNMFDACKQPAVRFRVAVYAAPNPDDPDDTTSFRTPRMRKSGELLDLAANPAADRGLFVAEYEF